MDNDTTPTGGVMPASILGGHASTTSGTNVNVHYLVTNDYSYDTPHVQVEGRTIRKPGEKPHPRLFFTFLKSGLNFIEEKTFKARMKRLEDLQKEFEATGQEAMSEECIKQFIVASRESAIFACDYKMYLTQEHVDNLKNKIYKMGIRGGHDLKITPLKNFARPLPKNVADRVKSCIEKKLFDEYVIFHLDNLSHTAVKATEKERIAKEKDPIIFGKVQFSDRYYFIADWLDSLDDFTMKDILAVMSLKKTDIKLKKEIEINNALNELAKDNETTEGKK